jgi:hypothetical protein
MRTHARTHAVRIYLKLSDAVRIYTSCWPVSSRMPAAAEAKLTPVRSCWLLAPANGGM